MPGISFSEQGSPVHKTSVVGHLDTILNGDPECRERVIQWGRLWARDTNHWGESGASMEPPTQQYGEAVIIMGRESSGGG